MQEHRKRETETTFFVLHIMKSGRTRPRNFHILLWYQISTIYCQYIGSVFYLFNHCSVLSKTICRYNCCNCIVTKLHISEIWYYCSLWKFLGSILSDFIIYHTEKMVSISHFLHYCFFYKGVCCTIFHIDSVYYIQDRNI